MNTKALGTWRQPPLAYVVAEAVISPYYNLAARIPGLQDRLRQAFPRTLEGQELIIDGAKPSAQPLWRMLSADQAHGVQIGTRGVSLHATSYQTSAEFLSRWAEVLDAIQAEDLGAFVERAGLRYVDLIVPSQGSLPGDYVAPGLQGVVPEGAVRTGSLWAAGYQLDGCVVNLRIGAPSPQGMLLPPDFNALPLRKPGVMAEAQQRVEGQQPIGYIDTDCGREIGAMFQAAELAQTYTAMQRLTSKTFRAAMSDLARKEWM